jgi:hypothetical protein
MTVVFQPPSNAMVGGSDGLDGRDELTLLGSIGMQPESCVEGDDFPRRDRAPQERMGGRISEMAGARFVGAPYVYVWADGVYLQAECMLVLMGRRRRVRRS